ncbi:hypothetical protein BDV95DRAFT_600413 [Massariosphaeria phaeospora]|uniref:Uncharacterized protein n=1 Tax=Massariosphaeria phaeospora TaxID=100035 RepID=A0A7C8I496_9PLEO|nr:hypothetical protein BDV95DRAFT_600413 [Massariosphaeria phaeospora]
MAPARKITKTSTGKVDKGNKLSISKIEKGANAEQRQNERESLKQLEAEITRLENEKTQQGSQWTLEMEEQLKSHYTTLRDIEVQHLNIDGHMIPDNFLHTSVKGVKQERDRVETIELKGVTWDIPTSTPEDPILEGIAQQAIGHVTKGKGFLYVIRVGGLAIFSLKLDAALLSNSNYTLTDESNITNTSFRAIQFVID